MPNNDYILRFDAISLIVGGNKLISKAKLMDGLARIPAADVEPVVRCKDCKFAFMTYDGVCKYCAGFGSFESKDESGELVYLPGDFFCAFGERKEVDNAE